MKGSFLILIFLFLIFLISPVAGDDFINGGFEDDFTSWTMDKHPATCSYSISTSEFQEGTKSYRMDVRGDSYGVGQVIAQQTVNLTNIDKISFYTKATYVHYPGDDKMYCCIGSTWYYYTDGVHDWTKREIDTSSYSGNYQVYFGGLSTPNTALGLTAYMDNIVAEGANIVLNQSFYNDPEMVQMDAELSGYDPTNYIYTTRLYGYTFGGWGALTQVDYNESTVMDASTKSIVADIDSNWYDLPLQIKAVLLQFNKNDYTTTEIAESDVVSYSSYSGGDYGGGIINFNETYYVEPGRVNITWDSIGFDFENNEYWVAVMGSQDGESGWQYIDYDYSPEIESDEEAGSRSVALYYNTFNMPFHIKAILYVYNYGSGDTIILDTSDVIPYSAASAQAGNIWTEKSTYNISEIFYIEFETEYPTVEIELISDTYHDIRTMEGNGHGHLGYAFRTPHNFTAYLYEGGVVTNQTSFSVAATSPMLNIFLESVALKTQFALEYYTDNSSDTITGYRPDGSIFYGPVTDLETNKRKIITGISSSSPPGIYTISLFHDGTTYYNDTVELYSTSEWVYFEASKYETGDRIKIYSFVTDSRQQVRLTDSIGTAVITWTDSAGYIIPNSQTVLYFSLTDNNEYGMNVNSSIDAGTFRTGNWKVEIIGIDGKPLTNESTYDYTTVSKRIDSPEDTSNEMISIFFSPEGAFMLYTVCLTMMGLVLAKHPAGGGAGATVGVGFGVYFNVLPPWMLMLTVILLVVLGGVSVAAYYRGK